MCILVNEEKQDVFMLGSFNRYIHVNSFVYFFTDNEVKGSR